MFPPNSGKKRISAFTIPIHYHIGGHTRCNKARKRTKDLETGNGEVKISLLTVDMIIYIGNPPPNIQKDTRISDFSKAEGYKDATQLYFYILATTGNCYFLKVYHL